MHSDMLDFSVAQWRAWLAQGTLEPYFQAIFSVQNQDIYGYEVLGRRLDADGQVQSLGPFFESGDAAELSNPQSPLLELKREVDLQLRAKALARFQQEAPPATQLFINMPPSLMARWTPGENKLPTSIRMIRESGVDPRRNVMEITEEAFPGHLEPFLELVAQYRREGYRIALDDVGAESSNLDRMGLFHPDIVKVDLALIKRAIDSRNFREILFGLARLAESLGSELLFEGIENDEELYNALDKGASYLQGFLFSRPSATFAPMEPVGTAVSRAPGISRALEVFHSRKINELRARAKRENQIQGILSLLPLELDGQVGQVTIGARTLDGMQDLAFRFYVTDLSGRQVSPNYQLLDGAWQIDRAFLGRNWSTRPYFFDHVYQSFSGNSWEWSMSETYWDIEVQALVRTFSHSTDNGLIVFMDVKMGDLV